MLFRYSWAIILGPLRNRGNSSSLFDSWKFYRVIPSHSAFLKSTAQRNFHLSIIFFLRRYRSRVSFFQWGITKSVTCVRNKISPSELKFRRHRSKIENTPPKRARGGLRTMFGGYRTKKKKEKKRKHSPLRNNPSNGRDGNWSLIKNLFVDKLASLYVLLEFHLRPRKWNVWIPHQTFDALQTLQFHI